MRISVATAAASFLAISLAIAADAEAAIRKTTNIAAQGLVDALNELAKLRELQVVYRTEVVGNLQTPGAVGELTADEAFKQILSGTGLTYRYIDDNTVTIVPIGASPANLRGISPRPRSHSSDTGGDEGGRKKSFWDWLRLAQVERRADVLAAVDQSGTTAASSPAPALEEIIVTATKRAESIQDVPLSITAIGSEEIERRGLVSAADYLRGIPGVNQTARAHGQSIIIRGIETSPQSQNFSSGTTVATYFGETSTTSTAGTGGETNVDIKLADIERVEVLRGPQGTSFGSSSLGGAVRTIPNAPKLSTFEGRVAVDYSVTSGSGDDNTDIQAVANLPIMEDKLAVRAVGYRYEAGGFYRNVAGSSATFQAGPPTRYGAQASATDERHVGTDTFTGGRIAALFQANDALKFTLSYLNQNNETDGIAFANTGRYEQAVFQIAPEHVERGQEHGFVDSNIALANATMEYAFSWANLIATFSHIKSGTEYGIPAAPIGFDWALSLGLDSIHREHSGEIRLATHLDGAWNFLAGLYGEKLDDDYDLSYLWFGDPATNIVCPACRSQRFTGLFIDRRELEQRAAFGEVSWKFLPAFTLTGGVRAYEYDRSVGTSGGGPLFTGSTTAPPASEAAAEAAAVSGDASGTSFSGNLSYKPSENALLYAGWSQGFRLGRPQPGLPIGSCDRDGNGIVDGTTNITIEQTRRLTSDEVDNFEIGAKFSLFERRLVVAADVYRIDWSGVPFRVLAPAPPAGCGTAYNANAGDARSEGLELQGNFHATDALRFDIAGAWVRARLREDAPGVGGFRGDRLPGSPKVNASFGVQYDFSIAGRKAFVRTDSIYVGSFYGNLQESAPTEAGGYVKVDATGGVALGNLSIKLFARNLTNEDDYTWRDVTSRAEFFGYRLRPRTIGVQLDYSF